LAKGVLRRGHEAGFDERCGSYPEEKRKKISEISGGILWVHAVSVGESQAASPFVSVAAESGFVGGIIVSTVTETGAKSVAALMGDKITSHVYAPWDVPFIVKKAVEILKPSLYITVETEDWPNLLYELRRRGIPSCLLNARVSDRTLKRAGKLGGLLREAYNMFDLIMPRGEEDGRRLVSLGVDAGKIKVTGDCKIDAIFNRQGSAKKNIPHMREKLSLDEHDRTFVAGSTHEGEDEIILRAYSDLKTEMDIPNARLIIAPRHPDRARAVLALAGPDACLYSEMGTFPGRSEIVVVDVIGALYELYGLSNVAFIGGSLVARGGQNILEPASWGIPILHGPHMEDFAEPTSALDSLKAAYCVRDVDDMKNVLRGFILDGSGDIAQIAASWFEGKRGASDRAWQFVRELLRDLRYNSSLGR
jgi:3-deoxy-D-manno-octulosonic-acid transferase